MDKKDKKKELTKADIAKDLDYIQCRIDSTVDSIKYYWKSIERELSYLKIISRAIRQYIKEDLKEKK